jgi:hypothetical protein
MLNLKFSRRWWWWWWWGWCWWWWLLFAGCDIMAAGSYVPTFRKKLLPASPGWKKWLNSEDGGSRFIRNFGTFVGYHDTEGSNWQIM